MRTLLNMRYLVLKYQYYSHNAIKEFIIPDQYNKENAYWTDLFTRVLSHELRKLELIWYDISSNIQIFGLYICKVPIVYYYLVISISNWWKIIHLSSKSLSWWYIHAHPESCKIIHQVSVQTLVYVCISITSCKNKIVHFRRNNMDI